METGRTVAESASGPESEPGHRRGDGKFLSGPAFENLAIALLCLLCGLFLGYALYNLARIQGAGIINTQESQYSLGYTLYATGRLSVDGYPSTFRAPGYPAFVALSLHGRDLLRSVSTALHLPIPGAAFGDMRFMVMIQLILLLVGGFTVYRIMRHWLDVLPAIFFMLAYLINPLTLTAIRFLNYYVLDYVLITLIIGLLAGLILKKDIAVMHMLALGVFFAAACLNRPLYLTAPVLIFAVLWSLKRLEPKKSIGLTLAFTLAMLGGILPYSIRNRAVTGRFMLVSNQGPWVLWANSVTPFHSLGHPPRWIPDVWDPYGARIYTQTTGAPWPDRFYQYANELSDAYNREFVHQLTTQPLIYAGNVINNFVLYVTYPPKYFERRFWQLIPSRFAKHVPLLQTIFSGYSWAATILSLPLLLFLAYRNYPPAKLGVFLLLYLATSYSLIFLDERFLYPRIPVLIFSLAVIPEGIASFFQNRPARFSSISALLLSALSAVAFASPVIYLASLEVNPLNLFHR